MQLFSRYAGASISALGAVLVLCGALLPTYGSGDYESGSGGLWSTPVLLIAMLIAPALLVLGSSALAWFCKLPMWLVVLCLVIIIPAFFLHVFVSVVVAGFACFDVCPPGGVHFGTGFWLPLVGFLLSVIGVAVAAATQKRCTSPGNPATAP